MKKGALFFLCFALVFFLLPFITRAGHLNPEAHYQKIWCDAYKGEAEVVMIDKTRCDCITKNYAIEVDFARKWTEGVGQALHYSRLTGKKAGIVLIVEEEEDLKYWNRLREAAHYFDLPITLWIIRP